MNTPSVGVEKLSEWIKWHRDGRGFTYRVTITSKGTIIVNYRLTRNGNIRRDLVLMSKRSKSSRDFNGKLLFEEYYDKRKINALIQALRDLSSLSSPDSSSLNLIDEIEKIIVHLSFLKKFLKGGG